MKKKIEIEGDFEFFIINKRLSLKDTFVVILQGARMTTLHDLYREIETALQFPMYFGGNWNAVDEMITDFEWIREKNYMIGINDFEKILSECEVGNEDKQAIVDNEIKIFIEILIDAINYWHSPVQKYEWNNHPYQDFDVYIQENGQVYQLLPDGIDN